MKTSTQRAGCLYGISFRRALARTSNPRRRIGWTLNNLHFALYAEPVTLNAIAHGEFIERVATTARRRQERAEYHCNGSVPPHGRTVTVPTENTRVPVDTYPAARRARPVSAIVAGRLNGELRHILPGLNGYMASLGALTGNDDIDATCDAAKDHLRGYERRSRRSFCDRTQEKRRKLQ